MVPQVRAPVLGANLSADIGKLDVLDMRKTTNEIRNGISAPWRLVGSEDRLVIGRGIVEVGRGVQCHSIRPRLAPTPGREWAQICVTIASDVYTFWRNQP